MPGDPNEISTKMRPAQSLERPAFAMPAGACDAHMHVFEARGEFPSTPLLYPSVPDANYTLPDGGLDHYLKLMPVLGIGNFVIVQPSFYGTDNSCLIDALAEAGPIARGIVNIEPGVSDADLARLHDAGVRGVRLDLFKRASLPIVEVQAYIRQMAARVAPLGWHLQFYTPGAIVRDSMDMLAELEIAFVVDHMGYMLAKDGLTEDDFERMLGLLRDGHCWLKLSAPYRLARHSSLEAVDRVARAIVAAAPQKVLWGSDWPHIPDGTRDTGELLNALATWAPDAVTRRMILVDNPRQLFDFAAAPAGQDATSTDRVGMAT